MMHQDSLSRYRNSLQGVRVLDRETERNLASSWAVGDQLAGARLVESSLPFVIRIAREYRRWGVPLEDLIQQGNLGLLKAAAKFDPDKDCRLITYAAYWIRAEIRDYVVRNYRIVRLGTTRTERRAMRAYRREEIDSPEALAEVSGMPSTRVRQLWPILTRGDMSLDVPKADTSTTPLDRLSAGSPDPEQLVGRLHLVKDVRDALGDAMDSLTEREQRIVSARMLSEEPDTLESLGREMGVSKERVRQLEARAKTKLRDKLARFAPAA